MYGNNFLRINGWRVMVDFGEIFAQAFGSVIACYVERAMLPSVFSAWDWKELGREARDLQDPRRDRPTL